MQKRLIIVFLLLLLSQQVTSPPPSSLGPAVEHRAELSPEDQFRENPSEYLQSGDLSILSPAQINQHFSSLPASRQSELSDSQINSLSPQNLKQLSSPDAMRRVSGENIRHLSGDQISQVGPQSLSDAQLKGLTAQQLLTRDNFDKVTDKSKLDPNVLNQVLSQRAGTTVLMQTQGKPTSGKLLPTGFEFDVVPFVQLLARTDTIAVTNGEQVRYENNRLKAKKADSLEYKGALSRKVYTLEADEVKLFVGKADDITAGCFAAHNITNSNISVNQSEIILSGSSANIRYGENSFTYNSAASNSSVTLDPNACFRPKYLERGQTYSITSATIYSSTPTGVETIHINTTGFLNASPDFGVYCALLSPNSVYDFELDGERDFSIRADGFHQVCVRRNNEQSFTRDCSSCSVVDLLNSELSTKGKMAYLRREPVFASKNIDGMAVIDFKNIQNDIVIETDSPEYVTRINEMSQIIEMKANNETHRFLDINETAQSVTGFVGNYSVYYGDGSLFVENSIINYSTNDGFEVVVLPPQHPLIESLALVLGLLYWRRKSQLTIFMIIGLSILIGAGLLFWMLGTSELSVQAINPADTSSIINYVQSCLEQAADDSLLEFGKPSTIYNKGNSLVPSEQQAIKVLGEKSAELLAECAAGFKAAGNEVVRGKPSVDVLLGEQEVIFDANYPVAVSQGQDITKAEKFGTKRKVRLKRIIQVMDELAASLKNKNMFDITAAQTRDASLLFYVHDGKIFTKITDRTANIKNNIYSTVVTSIR